MKIIHGIELKQGSYEELLPDFSPDFPYIASYVELDKHVGRQSPWHWHKEVELFYMLQGALEYSTPQKKLFFSKGSAGFVNSNVLHMSKAIDGIAPVISLLHIFNPILISGYIGSIIDQKYVSPLVTSSGIEIISIYPDSPEHLQLLDTLRQSFELSEQNYYEIKLRAVLSELWCKLLDISKPLIDNKNNSQTNDKIKMMMAFIHKHYYEKITIPQIASNAFISERECFRIFRNCLKMTPVEYITNYRIQRACYMLTESNESITYICQACGLGSSSYFSKLFHKLVGCSPTQYRIKSISK